MSLHSTERHLKALVRTDLYVFPMTDIFQQVPLPCLRNLLFGINKDPCIFLVFQKLPPCPNHVTSFMLQASKCLKHEGSHTIKGWKHSGNTRKTYIHTHTYILYIHTYSALTTAEAKTQLQYSKIMVIVPRYAVSWNRPFLRSR